MFVGGGSLPLAPFFVLGSVFTPDGGCWGGGAVCAVRTGPDNAHDVRVSRRGLMAVRGCSLFRRLVSDGKVMSRTILRGLGLGVHSLVTDRRRSDGSLLSLYVSIVCRGGVGTFKLRRLVGLCLR